MFKSKLFLQIFFSSIAATLATALIVSAATTIGNNISTDGTLTITNTTATSTFSTGGLIVGTDKFVVQQTSGRVGIGTASPLAKLHVGNGTTNNSSDSQILISRAVDDSVSGNGHAFSDSSLVTRSGTIGYNSFDARIDYSGTNNFDHYAAFQAAPAYDSSGTMTNYYGLYTLPSVTSGTITNSFGVYVGNPSGDGSVTNNYGIYFNSLTKGSSKNYAIYSSGSNMSYLEGSLGIGSHAASPAKNLEIYTASGVEAGIRIRQDGQNYWDFISPANQSRLDISDVNGTYLSVLSSGNIGVGTTSPSYKLHVYGGNIGVSTNQGVSSVGNLLLTGGGTGLVLINGGNGTADLSSTGSNDLRIAGTVGGNSGKGLYLKAYNGSLWRTGLQYLNVSGGEPNLILVPSFGNVGIGTSTPAVLLHASSGTNATTTVEFGDQYTNTSKTCFNIKTSAGASASFYFNASGIVFENNRCR